MLKRTIMVAVLAAVLTGLASPALYAQCAACKEALTSDANGSAGWSQGFNWSVLVMIGTMFGLAAIIVGSIVREAIRAKPQDPSAAP